MRDGGLWIGVVYGIATSLVALVIGVGCGVWLYGCTVERIILNETVYYPAPKATP